MCHFTGSLKHQPRVSNFLRKTILIAILSDLFLSLGVSLMHTLTTTSRRA